MSRLISLNARRALDGIASPENEIVLLHITHPETNEIVRVATGATERLSAEPLRYGVRSRWMGSDPETEPFFLVALSLQLPDDVKDAPSTASFVLGASDNAITMALRSTTQQASVGIAVILADEPDAPQAEWRGLLLMEASGQVSITLNLSREPVTNQPWPSGRMTRERFPGLFP